MEAPEARRGGRRVLDWCFQSHRPADGPPANGGGLNPDLVGQTLDAIERAVREQGDGHVVGPLLHKLRAQLDHASFHVPAENAEFERLRQSEARWRSIAENPFDFVVVVDASGTILYLNRTEAHYRMEDVVGKTTVFDYAAPEGHAAIRAAIAQVFQDGKSAYFEDYVPSISKWFGNVIGPVLRNGRVVAASILAREITRQKEDEIALRESEERFRQLAENIEDVFLLLEPVEQRPLYISPAGKTLWGREMPTTGAGFGVWLEGIHPDDRNSVAQSYAAMAAACRGEASDFTFRRAVDLRLLRPDGSVRWARIRLFPVLDGAGRVRRVAGIVSDVTERVETDAKLAHAVARFRTLVEKLPVISYVTDPAILGKTLYISPQIEAKLGYSPEEWLGDPDFWLSRVHPDDRGRVLDGLRRFHHDGEPLRCRYRMVARDGTEQWFHDEAVMVRDGPAGPMRIQGVLLDVSEAEEARAEQQRARAVSAHLVEVQEQERRKIARELHDEVGQSLTSLNFLLQSVRECPGERPGVAQEARSLVGELMQKVRDLSLELRPSMLDDLGLLPTLFWMFERFTKQTRVHVQFEHQGMDERFHAEIETAAYRIVQEALTNVARHSGVGVVDVRARCDGAVLGLQIEDTGQGFDLGGCRASRASGLAGMRERVALLGGEMLIDSVPGRGTHINVRLPLRHWVRPCDGAGA